MRTLLWGEIRRRWRAAAVIGLVLGVGLGAALTAAAGARRTQRAYPHMLVATDSAQLLVSTGGGPGIDAFYQSIRGVSGVARVGRFVGVGLVPTHVARGSGTEIQSCSTAAWDDTFGSTVDRPNLLQGRLPRPDRADEVWVTKTWADSYGVRLGDTFDVVVHSQDVAPRMGEATAADGPVARVHAVGIGVPSTQVVPVSDLDKGTRIIATRAFRERYLADPQTWCFDGAAVLLAPSADGTAVIERIRSLAPRGQVFIQDLRKNHRDVQNAIQPQVTALWVFALAAAVSTLLIAVQLVGRQLGEAATWLPVWKAVGADRRQLRGLVAAPVAVIASVAALVSSGVALGLSGQFPIGPARLAETARGARADAAVLGLGVGAAIVVTVAIGWVVGALIVSRGGRRRPSVVRPGRLARLGSSASAPEVTLGVELASSRAPGRNAPPVRTSVAGTALALAALFATLAFTSGLDALVSNPARYGRDWDVMLDGQFSATPVGLVLHELAHDPAVVAIAGGRYTETTIDGQTVATVGLSDLVGTTMPTLVAGRAPERDDEIVVGALSLRRLHRAIGDVVSVDTGEGATDMKIVGSVAFPQLAHGSFGTLGLGEGALVRTTKVPSYSIDDNGGLPPGSKRSDFVRPDGQLFELVTVRLRAGTSAAERARIVSFLQGLADRYGNLVRVDQRPTAIDNYAATRSTPKALTVVLSVMAAATLANLVVSVVRRRRRDLALCVALGMSRGQIVRSVVVSAAVIAGGSLALALPLGVAAGRLAWRHLASGLGVPGTAGFPVVGLLVAVLATGLGAVAVAVVPALIGARRSPAAVLRAEAAG